MVFCREAVTAASAPPVATGADVDLPVLVGRISVLVSVSSGVSSLVSVVVGGGVGVAGLELCAGAEGAAATPPSGATAAVIIEMQVGC